MSVVLGILIVSLIGTPVAKPDKNFNKKVFRPSERSYVTSINADLNNNIKKIYPSLQIISGPALYDDEKVYEPKEDPRLFYQSEPYVNNLNIRNEVSEIYPGRDVIRGRYNYYRNYMNTEGRSKMRLSNLGYDICIKCPSDVRIVVRSGSSRVKLKPQKLFTCANKPAPLGVHFVIMYGPNYGTYIGEGVYRTVGHISYNNKIIEYCAMNLHVQAKKCHVHRHLLAECDSKNRTCVFSCRDPRTVLYGSRKLDCIDNKWNGILPLCRTPKTCQYPPPPQHGKLTCKVAENSTSLWEGSKCRVRCQQGWRPSLRSLAICRNGSWTHNLTCVPKNT